MNRLWNLIAIFYFYDLFTGRSNTNYHGNIRIQIDFLLKSNNSFIEFSELLFNILHEYKASNKKMDQQGS